MQEELLEELKEVCKYLSALSQSSIDAVEGYAWNECHRLTKIIRKYDPSWVCEYNDEEWEEYFPI